MNPAEAALTPARPAAEGDRFEVPWSRLLRARTVWLLCGQFFPFSYA